MAEIRTAKRVQRKQTQRSRTNSLSKVQTEAPRQNNKREFKQQQQQQQQHQGQPRLKNDSIFNLRLFQEFTFVQFVSRSDSHIKMAGVLVVRFRG